jgi:uncharacterized protein YidB (DUF937 family)
METSWRFRVEVRCGGATGARAGSAWLPFASLIRVDAAAAGAVLGLHLGAVTDRARAVGLAGLLDGQVHGGAGSRLKSWREQVAEHPISDMAPSPRTYPYLLTTSAEFCGA